MSWAIKQSSTGDNSKCVSDPNSESKHRDYTPGKFYDGNHTKNRQDDMLEQGSEGLDRNQGHTIDSFIPTTDPNDETWKPKKLKEQGSHAHLGIRSGKVSREL